MGQPYPALPPVAFWLWMIPSFLQCLLLHPRFPSAFSRLGRLALMLPTVQLAYRAPVLYPCTPRDIMRGENAVGAFGCMYVIWKALEWGLVQDRSAYDWVGWGQDAKEAGEGAEKQGNADAAKLRLERRRKEESWARVLVNQSHLWVSYRMLGYRAYAGRPPRPVSESTFLRRTLLKLVGTHLGLVAGMSWISFTSASRHALLESAFPALAAKGWTTAASIMLDYAALGLAAYQSLALMQVVFALTFFAVNKLGRRVGLPLAPFETREWTPLFTHPYFPESIARLWSYQWQTLFRHCFQTGAMAPYYAVLGVTGSPAAAKAFGMLVVEFMTALIHEFAIRKSTDGLKLAFPRETFLERNGGHIFFLTQGAAALLEQGFTMLTGCKVKGPLGFVWSGLVLGPTIFLLLGPAWGGLQFTNGILVPEQWSWVRWAVPFACVAPEPLWMVK